MNRSSYIAQYMALVEEFYSLGLRYIRSVYRRLPDYMSRLYAGQLDEMATDLYYMRRMV